MPAPEAALNSFLYASIGDDREGMVLTVLSALARLDVDPWSEAADLSRLPRASAAVRFASLLESLPGHRSLADRTAIAGRLIPLLPVRSERRGPVDAAPARPLTAAQEHPSWMNQVSFSLLYGAVLCLGLLMYSEFSERVAAGLPAATSAPSTATVATATAAPARAAPAVVADAPAVAIPPAVDADRRPLGEAVPAPQPALRDSR